MSSPAERYAAARRRNAHPTLADFTTELGFSLDPFQVEACEALEQGSGVLVCAPTGAGKTVVGEFAVHKALQEGRKAFYTTPIKALSNQKYSDLCDRYGPSKVGLLTGDNAINSDAEEFADWLVTVRGDTAVVVSEVRPIPLWQHMLVAGRVFDLFALRPAAHAGEWEQTPHGLSTRERGRAVVDPELVRYVHEQERRYDSWHGGGGGGLRGGP